MTADNTKERRPVSLTGSATGESFIITGEFEMNEICSSLDVSEYQTGSENKHMIQHQSDKNLVHAYSLQVQSINTLAHMLIC